MERRETQGDRPCLETQKVLGSHQLLQLQFASWGAQRVSWPREAGPRIGVQSWASELGLAAQNRSSFPSPCPAAALRGNKIKPGHLGDHLNHRTREGKLRQGRVMGAKWGQIPVPEC